MSHIALTVDAELEKLQRETFGYFLHETNPANGLVIDKTAPDWPSSIAATGLALAFTEFCVSRFFALIDIFWHSVFEHYCEMV